MPTKLGKPKSDTCSRNKDIIDLHNNKKYSIKQLQDLYSLSEKSIRNILHYGVNSNRQNIGQQFPDRFSIVWIDRNGKRHKRNLLGRY